MTYLPKHELDRQIHVCRCTSMCAFNWNMPTLHQIANYWCTKKRTFNVISQSESTWWTVCIALSLLPRTKCLESGATGWFSLPCAIQFSYSSWIHCLHWPKAQAAQDCLCVRGALRHSPASALRCAADWATSATCRAKKFIKFVNEDFEWIWNGVFSDPL